MFNSSPSSSVFRAKERNMGLQWEWLWWWLRGLGCGRGWRPSISCNEIWLWGQEQTVLRAFCIPLRCYLIDPGLRTKINSVIPGRQSGQKLVFAKVSAVFAIERTNMPNKTNAPEWPNWSNKLIDPFGNYIYLALGIYLALLREYIWIKESWKGVAL